MTFLMDGSSLRRDIMIWNELKNGCLLAWMRTHGMVLIGVFKEAWCMYVIIEKLNIF